MPSPILVKANRIGGNLAAYNLSVAQVVANRPGDLMRLIVQAPGTTSGALTFNDSNALVTAQTITAITQAASAVVTVSTGGGTNPFAVGNTIAFAGVGGMTQINSVFGQVTAIGGVTTAWTITTNINSSAFSAFTSGGTAASFSAANQIITIPFGSLSIGLVVPLECPVAQGILISAVPTAGSPLYTVTYD